jgi:hypothetical protein
MSARIFPGDGDPRHGSANGYNNLQCRCAPCTAAWAAYRLALGAKARPPLPPGDPRHGTSSGLRWWHCHCRLCLDKAAADEARGRRQRAVRTETG